MAGAKSPLSRPFVRSRPGKIDGRVVYSGTSSVFEHDMTTSTHPAQDETLSILSKRCQVCSTSECPVWDDRKGCGAVGFVGRHPAYTCAALPVPRMLQVLEKLASVMPHYSGQQPRWRRRVRRSVPVEQLPRRCSSQAPRKGTKLTGAMPHSHGATAKFEKRGGDGRLPSRWSSTARMSNDRLMGR